MLSKIYKDILRNYDGDQGFKDALYDWGRIHKKHSSGLWIAEAITKVQKPHHQNRSIRKIIIEKGDADE